MAADAVVHVVRSITEELHPSGGWVADLDLDSSLEVDAGLDSLSRMELLTRLETVFSQRLPEEDVLGAETISDVVGVIGPVAVGSVRSDVRPAPVETPPKRRVAAAAESCRSGVGTVCELLSTLAAECPDLVVIHLMADGEISNEITALDLFESALALAHPIGREVEPGQPVGIMLPTGRDFLDSFFGVLLAGGVPVPLAPPARLAQIEDHVRRQVSILDNCQAPLLLTSREILHAAHLARRQAAALRQVTTVGELRSTAGTDVGREVPVVRSTGDLALLQYTSGSTGDPKGVMLTHANLLANVAAIAERLETSPTDVYVSWLPLYHDMGLIGGVLHGLYCGIPLVLIPPQAFLARPVRWLRAIERFGGTMTVAPNFAYEICRRRLTDEDLKGLDLRSLRLTLNGAEPVSADTIEGFTRRFEPYGYRADAMAPCYGLAENTLAVSCARRFRAPRIDTVDREVLLREERAVPVSHGDGGLRLVGCGPLMRGVEVRVLDRSGREVGEREIGRIVFRGSSATSGYYRNPAATEALIEDGWRDSGDLGYRSGEDIFVTGRAKDLVIRAGLNIVPSVLEEAVGGLAGVRRGCVAVFGTRDCRLGSERLVVAAETRERYRGARQDLRHRINEASIAAVGIAPDEVALLPPRTLLKTSSGKLRRTACRRLCERDELGGSSRTAVWRQLGRVWLGGLRAMIDRAARRLGAGLFNAWAWTLAGLLLAVIWFGVLLLPRVEWRHAWARRMCRLFFGLVVPFEVEGLEHLPAEGPFVIASNHASYVDSMVLFASLPRNLAFAAKREFDDHLVTRPLMRRLGAVFVDRRAAGQAATAIRQLRQEAERRGLAVFVEGTFGPEPGLRSFRLGAFQVAAEAGCPVVPLVIEGSRQLLRDEQWMFRRSAVRVTILPPARPRGAGFSAAVALRDAVREEMLEVVGEPDLGRHRAAGEEPVGERGRWKLPSRLAGEERA